MLRERHLEPEKCSTSPREPVKRCIIAARFLEASNFFGKLKDFKRIAMRADKTDQSFSAMIHLVAAVISSR